MITVTLLRGIGPIILPRTVLIALMISPLFNTTSPLRITLIPLALVTGICIRRTILFALTLRPRKKAATFALALLPTIV